MAKILAIIPARANSKGVPGKNKMKLNGISLVDHAFNVANASKYIDDIVITTDDVDIINSFKNKNVKINKRKKSLSTDDSPIVDTINYIINDYDDEYDFLLLLQPTSPIRSTNDLDKCILKLLNSPEINSIISVCRMDDVHPGRMYWLLENSTIESVLDKYEESRRQDNKPVYFRNGSIYLTRTKSFKKNNSMMEQPIHPYIMDSEFLLNIDSHRDKLIAEKIFNYWLKSL
tara:strand:+ start:666 stop:1358 length:693 start_codon:yes stop_codon:yes gene_type:complete